MSTKLPIFVLMKMTLRYKHHTIRFRQWSRRAFAAFLSLGRVVTIGHVSKSVTEVSLTKVEKYIRPGLPHLVPSENSCCDKPPEFDIPDIDHVIATQYTSDPTECACRVSFPFAFTDRKVRANHSMTGSEYTKQSGEEHTETYVFLRRTAWFV